MFLYLPLYKTSAVEPCSLTNSATTTTTTTTTTNVIINRFSGRVMQSIGRVRVSVSVRTVTLEQNEL